MPRYSIRWCDCAELVDVAFTLEEAWRTARYLSYANAVIVVDEDTGKLVLVKEGTVL